MMALQGGIGAHHAAIRQGVRPAFMVFEKIMAPGSVNVMASCLQANPQPKWRK
jgi:hypothetical protein